jgi:hypothetical protein
MKKSTILGFIAMSATIGYFLTKKSEDKDAKIEGIDIKINPERLIDGALAMTRINPIAKEGLRNIAQRALVKYYEGD